MEMLLEKMLGSCRKRAGAAFARVSRVESQKATIRPMHLEQRPWNVVEKLPDWQKSVPGNLLRVVFVAAAGWRTLSTRRKAWQTSRRGVRGPGWPAPPLLAGAPVRASWDY